MRSGDHLRVSPQSTITEAMSAGRLPHSEGFQKALPTRSVYTVNLELRPSPMSEADVTIHNILDNGHARTYFHSLERIHILNLVGT